MSNKKKKWSKRLRYAAMGAGTALVMLPIMLMGGYGLTYHQRVMPGVIIAGSPVGGMNEKELERLIQTKVDNYINQWPQTMVYDQYVWTIPFPKNEIEFQVSNTVVSAMQKGREGKPWERIQSWFKLWNSPEELPVNVRILPDWETNLTASIAATIDKEKVPPRLWWDEKKDEIKMEKGISGRKLLKEAFEKNAETATGQLKPWDIAPYIQEMPVSLSNEDGEKAKQRGEGLKDLVLEVSVGTESAREAYQLSGKEMVDWIQFGGGYKDEEMMVYLESLKETVDRPPVNAKLNFNNQEGKAVEFSPPLNGWSLNISSSKKMIETELAKMEAATVSGVVDLVVDYQKPEIGLEQVNDLGINELLGYGESTYFHSIPTRVHNVGLAAERINGTLVKPGEVFSFNESVGEISGATGYKQAYIIKDGKTELGDGGGVCQDSTTVFRAALDAGLPIVERRAHAYRVGYYEQDTKAGIDATVYSPSTDLKFLNNTPAHILVQVTNDSANRYLKVEIYGTSDGRKSEILNHVVWGVTPPLPDVFIDDPTLPNGEVKQIDWKAAGAKAKFDYRVVRNGEILIEETFTSNYKPWASVFLRGVGQ